jgi:hypothetical protein
MEVDVLLVYGKLVIIRTAFLLDLPGYREDEALSPAEPR